MQILKAILQSVKNTATIAATWAVIKLLFSHVANPFDNINAGSQLVANSL